MWKNQEVNMSLTVLLFKILWIYLFIIFIIGLCTKTEAPKMSLSSVIEEQYLGEPLSICWMSEWSTSEK